MNAFDSLVAEMDELQDETFAIDVLIDGQESRGVFEEELGEFESADDVYRTLEVNKDKLPENTKVGSIVKIVSSGKLFEVTRKFPQDSIFVLVLA